MLQSRKKVEIAVFLETTLLAVGYKCELAHSFPGQWKYTVIA